MTQKTAYIAGACLTNVFLLLRHHHPEVLKQLQPLVKWACARVKIRCQKGVEVKDMLLLARNEAGRQARVAAIRDGHSHKVAAKKDNTARERERRAQLERITYFLLEGKWPSP